MPAFGQLDGAILHPDCATTSAACAGSEECQAKLTAYSTARTACINEKCGITGDETGNEYRKKLQNCDYECVTFSDAAPPSGWQHMCIEIESEGRHADSDEEDRFEFKYKHTEGSLTPNGCVYNDKQFSASQMMYDAMRKANDGNCEVTEDKTYCAEYKKGKISPCSGSGTVSAAFAFGVVALSAILN
ncbi:MAG: hypothetical protein MHM6MM_005124 [Cercozoa sp. M6MM]